MTSVSRVAVGVLLVIAGGCTLLMVPVVAELHPVSGPDTMGLFSVLVVAAVRWAALAAALAVAAGHGRFVPFGRSRAVQAAVVLAFHALSGGASLGSLITATNIGSPAVHSLCWAFTVLVPALVVGAAAAAVFAVEPGRIPVAGARVAAVLLLAAVSAGAATLWAIDHAHTADVLARQAAIQAERDRLLNAQIARVRATRQDAPLAEWLPWLDFTEERVLTPAVAAIRARPALEADLADALRGPESVRALRFVWLWMPEPPPGLAPSIRSAIAALPAWAVRELDKPVPAGPDAPRGPDLSSTCEAAVAVSSVYEKQGVDFTPELRRLSEFFATQERRQDQPDRGYACREFLKTWIDAHPGR